MPDTPKLKTLDVHADYLMHSLMHNLRTALHILTVYMQTTTPYGDAYKKAYSRSMAIWDELNELESDLQDCVEAKQKEKKE